MNEPKNEWKVRSSYLIVFLSAYVSVGISLEVLEPSKQTKFSLVQTSYLELTEQ